MTCSICPGSTLIRPMRPRRSDDELHVLADHAPQHLLHAREDLVQIDDLRLQHLLAAEGEQLPRQRRPPALPPR